jgi:hypothetical protein
MQMLCVRWRTLLVFCSGLGMQVAKCHLLSYDKNLVVNEGVQFVSQPSCLNIVFAVFKLLGKLLDFCTEWHLSPIQTLSILFLISIRYSLHFKKPNRTYYSENIQKRIPAAKTMINTQANHTLSYHLVGARWVCIPKL